MNTAIIPPRGEKSSVFRAISQIFPPVTDGCRYAAHRLVQNDRPACAGRSLQSVEKASQSFAPAGAKMIRIIFCGGVYVAENTLRPASVEFFVLAQKIMRAAGCKPVQTKTQRSGFRLRACQKYFLTRSPSRRLLRRREGFCSAQTGWTFRRAGGILISPRACPALRRIA